MKQSTVIINENEFANQIISCNLHDHRRKQDMKLKKTMTLISIIWEDILTSYCRYPEEN